MAELRSQEWILTTGEPVRPEVCYLMIGGYHAVRVALIQVLLS